MASRVDQARHIVWLLMTLGTMTKLYIGGKNRCSTEEHFLGLICRPRCRPSKENVLARNVCCDVRRPRCLWALPTSDENIFAVMLLSLAKVANGLTQVSAVWAVLRYFVACGNGADSCAWFQK